MFASRVTASRARGASLRQARRLLSELKRKCGLSWHFQAAQLRFGQCCLCLVTLHLLACHAGGNRRRRSRCPTRGSAMMKSLKRKMNSIAIDPPRLGVKPGELWPGKWRSRW